MYQVLNLVARMSSAVYYGRALCRVLLEPSEISFVPFEYGRAPVL